MHSKTIKTANKVHIDETESIQYASICEWLVTQLKLSSSVELSKASQNMLNIKSFHNIFSLS